MSRNLTYLACPYSHKDPEIVRERFETICRVAGKLMLRGFLIFSPISHTHPIAQYHNMPGSWEFWKKQDMAFLEHCKEVIVLCVDGWEESVGVTEEIKWASECGLVVRYVDEKEIDCGFVLPLPKGTL